jgi:hypothetical protein
MFIYVPRPDGSVGSSWRYLASGLADEARPDYTDVIATHVRPGGAEALRILFPR